MFRRSCGRCSIDGFDLSILADGYAAPELTLYTVDSVSGSGEEGASGAIFTLDWNTLFTNLALEGQSNFGSWWVWLCAVAGFAGAQ